MIKANLTDFECFKVYTRGILSQIANAKIGPYHNASHMQEAVIVWRQGNGPALDFYPMPENITHIRTEPPDNPLDGGNYAFKDTLRILFERAGAKKTLQPEMSYMRKNEFNLNMHQGPYNIYALFIRYNGRNLKEKLDAVVGISDDQLHEACIAGCKASCIEIDYPPQP